MALPQKKTLEESLVEKGLITPDQLQQALTEQKAGGGRLGSILVKKGFITEQSLVQFMGTQLDVPRIDLDNYLIDPRVIDLVSRTLAKRYTLIPVYKTGNDLTVAMANPLNVFVVDELESMTKCKVVPAVAGESAILKAIKQYYKTTDAIDEIVKGIDKEKFEMEESEEIDLDHIEAAGDDVPIIKLVNLIIMQAINDRASDIHIEAEKNKLRVRYRVDGILYEVPAPPKKLLPALSSRIKIMSGMDIAEKRIPQDGRIRLKAKNKDIDLRVSTLPTMFGEKVEMRILERGAMIVHLDKLGMEADTRKQFEMVITKPYGIVLSTGPTGCGKSSTLYASMNRIKSIAKNIITIEDPIEYQMVLVNQVQINPKAGLTFASGLRSFLRQDPDIILVGEIRDLETAGMAVHASLTGHLVFSTLHTNDAPTAFTRLVDMGVEPFLVSSTITAVVAQRLVRTTCPKCKEAYEPSIDVVRDLGLPADKTYKFYRGKGCPHCKESGYWGRTGMFELMIPNERIKELVVQKAPATAVRKEALKSGMKSLRADGISKVLRGITTVEEVLRMTQEEEFKITATRE